jgi:DNA-directed RNA polymerase subunit RPC12/RpoP
MKIVEVKCNNCKAEYETLESIPKEAISCPGCESKDLTFTETDKEFNACGGGCSGCSGSCS